MCHKSGRGLPTKPLNPKAKEWIPKKLSNSTQSEKPNTVPPLPHQIFPSSQHLLPPPVATAAVQPWNPAPKQLVYHHQPSYFIRYVFHPQPRQYQSYNVRAPPPTQTHLYYSGLDHPTVVSAGGGGMVVGGDKPVKVGGRRLERPYGGRASRKRNVWVPPSFPSSCPPKVPRTVWVAKKTKSGQDQGVQEVVVDVHSPPPSPPSLPSLSDDDSARDNTTVMIRNIPNQFRREVFMEFLDYFCQEHHLEYDFFYLPMDFMNANYGYCFVNWTTPAAALKIRELLKNYQWGLIQTAKGRMQCKKICQVTWAKIQGKDALRRHFSGSNFLCSTYEYLPVVLSPPRNGFNCSLSSITTVGKLALCPKV